LNNLSLVRGTLISVLLGLLASLTQAQDVQPQTPAKVMQPIFFSGSVIALSESEVTVQRRALVSNETTRKFHIDPETKVEGKLNLKATVTVRYVTQEDGQIKVLSIIVR
jgi:hypothetical protein